MACAPTPTQTLYATLTTFSASTSFSQSGAQPQVTTVVHQTCVGTSSIGNSSVGCVSSGQVTEVFTLGGGQAAQVPIVVSVPVTLTQPTQTLFAPCSDGDKVTTSPKQQAPPSPTDTPQPVTTSVLVQVTLPPTTVVQLSSTTLENGSVVPTVVTMVTTLPPTAVYVPTSIPNPALQGNTSPGSGTNVAPIAGGVLGGLLGLVAIVGSLWWLCRRRRSWDDIFEKDDDPLSAVAARHERDSHKLDSIAEPKPYQYGLVGHVVPPAAASESLRTSHYDSVSEYSGTHSRNTSQSAVPLLHATRKGGSSRPSTAGSVHTHPGQRVLSPVGSTMSDPRSLSMISQSSSTRPQAPPSTWSPNMDELAALEPLNRSGSPVSATERRVLQIVNNGPPSPTDTVLHGLRRKTSRRSASVIMHMDGGRIPENPLEERPEDPPAYSQ